MEKPGQALDLNSAEDGSKLVAEVHLNERFGTKARANLLHFSSASEVKVKKLVKGVLPKGKAFQLRWQPVGFGHCQVLRVVTPAWRSLSRFERILKLQSALTDGLSVKERANILRVSVMTANEYKKLHPALFTKHRHRPRVGRVTNGK